MFYSSALMKVVTISSVDEMPVASLIYSKASSIIYTFRLYVSMSAFFSLLLVVHFSSRLRSSAAGFEKFSPPVESLDFVLRSLVRDTSFSLSSFS